MAKFTDLTQDTDPQHDDMVATVKDPGGTPLSRKATIDDVVHATVQWGGIYTLWATPPGAQTLVADTWTQVTQFNRGHLNDGAMIVAAHATDDVFLCPGAGDTGTYLILCTGVFVGVAAADVQLELRSQAGVVSRQGTGIIEATGDGQSFTMFWVHETSYPGEDFELWVNMDPGGSFEIRSGSLIAIRLGASAS